ncbi:MAG TPA: hypothetical protein VGK67_11050 [Myxococcales bacterium]|jgi:hypothetical protein
MGARGWGVAGVLVAALAAAGVGASCQSQQFYPVGPQAVTVGTTTIVVEGKALPPNIMLVVDKSGSMTQSVTGTGLACTSDGTVGATYDPRSTSPCKWNDLKTAFADPTTGFLVTSQGLARFGLAAFPASTGQCDTGSVLVPISDDVQAIRDQLLNRLSPGGGTPSAASLLEASKDSALVTVEPNRKRFAMLLTDGMPNCNSANAAKCAQCRANAASCDAVDGCRPTEVPGTCPAKSPFDGASCLDEDALVNAVSELAAKGIGTFVIGFGKDTSGSDANRVLTRAAVAGGYPREGAAEQYYQANSVAELKAFLEEILRKFPCSFKLASAASNAALVQVSIADHQNGTETVLRQGTDWQFPSATVLDEVQLLGDWCTEIQGADANRYWIIVRTVGKF